LSEAKPGKAFPTGILIPDFAALNPGYAADSRRCAPLTRTHDSNKLGTTQVGRTSESTRRRPVATISIVWNWGTNSNINFNPVTDILDFGWFAADQFTISEVNGTVVIAIPSNHQTYTLQHTTLSELHLSNIVSSLKILPPSALGRTRFRARRLRRPHRRRPQLRRRAVQRRGPRAASTPPA
jgi:hypothetical protein